MSVTAPSTVEVEAEWALWGLEQGDTWGYRLLRCSTGALDRATFERQLIRYSPGTLDQLPQVSVSWIKRRSDGHGSHLAIAFHETSQHDPPDSRSRGRRDHWGREITFVRYFCVRFDEVASPAICYAALYEGLHDVMAPAVDGAPIRVQIPALPVPVPPKARGAAEAIAAQLLTGRPVCLIGMGDAGAADRLRLIDQVMSLLPYGTRSCMSAATMVNSSYRQHKFRLFFASAPRSGSASLDYEAGPGLAGKSEDMPGDIVVDLGELYRAPGSLPVDDQGARQYLDWVRQASPAAIAQLAMQLKPVSLASRPEVAAMISALPVEVGTSVPALLSAVTEALTKHEATELTNCLGRLRRQLAVPGLLVDRNRCREIIRHHDLLRDSQATIPASVEADLLDALLALAVDIPLTYEGFSQVRFCARGRLGSSLLQAIGRLRPANAVPVILAGAGLGLSQEQVAGLLQRWDIAPEEPIRVLAADTLSRAPRISAPDGLIVYDVGLRYLLENSADPRSSLRDLGFLVPVIERLFPALEQKVNRQRLVLSSVFGPRLDRAAIREILADPALTTPALARAVYTMTRWKAFATKGFLGGNAPGPT